jgi:predicted enzyme related to lactoylglutathione lyase
VDIGVPDIEGAAAFYGALFGWKAELDPRPEAGGYGMLTLDGKNVAGIGPQQNPDLPPFWTVYVTVADCDASVASAREHGGTVVVDPIDVFDAGRMGVLQDPNGSFISVWQPDQHIGCQLVNDPGTFVWNELATTDLATSNTFYRALFDWQLEPHASSDQSSIYTLDGEVICGAHVAGEGEFPAWSVWFAVADTDATAAQVRELGGTVIVEPNDMSFGRGGVVADPFGAVFGMGTMNDT